MLSSLVTTHRQERRRVAIEVEIESRGGEMKMKMDVRVCDIKLKVIRVVDSGDPGEIHRDRLAI